MKIIDGRSDYDSCTLRFYFILLQCVEGLTFLFFYAGIICSLNYLLSRSYHFISLSHPKCTHPVPVLLIYLLFSFLSTTVLYHSVLFLFFQYFPPCHFIPSYLHLSSFFLLCSSSVLPFYFNLFLLSILIPYVFSLVFHHIKIYSSSRWQTCRIW